MFIKWHLLHSCFDFVQISGTDIYEISFYFLEYGFTTSNIIKWWKYIYCAYLIMCVSELYSDFCHQVDCYCRSFAYSSPDASYVSYNGKICKDMWGAEFKMLSTCVCVCVLFLLLPRSFVILIVTILCRVKVTLQNGGRKKEIRSVIPKVSYDSERLKLSYFQFNVLKDNCWKINPSF